MVAIVGRSGAGKTTLVNLLPRFYDVSSGGILIDGVDLRNVTLSSLRQQIGIVTQDTVLFDDTVAHNIAYGTPRATPQEVEAAARAAHAHEFIVALPDGYQTMIGERGQRLSGGQRQRMAIARALLKNAPILVLDEATSALDTESERLVQEALTNLMMNRTSFVIAHRLSTIRRADAIIVLERGRVVEMGRHDDLLTRTGGTYAMLYQMQLLEGRKAGTTDGAVIGREAGQEGRCPASPRLRRVRRSSDDRTQRWLESPSARKNDQEHDRIFGRHPRGRVGDDGGDHPGAEPSLPGSAAADPAGSGGDRARGSHACRPAVARGRVELSLSLQLRQTPAVEVEFNETFGAALSAAHRPGAAAGPGRLAR